MFPVYSTFDPFIFDPLDGVTPIGFFPTTGPLVSYPQVLTIRIDTQYANMFDDLDDGSLGVTNHTYIFQAIPFVLSGKQTLSSKSVETCDFVVYPVQGAQVKGSTGLAGYALLPILNGQ